MKTGKFTSFASSLFLLLSLLVLSNCRLVQLFDPTLTPIPATTSTATASPVPAAYQTMNVNEYSTFTIYWKRDLWESAITGNILTEDFEKDEADYGELSYPYLTGNGFLLNGGRCPAQIFRDPTLMNSGNLIHFRDFGCGLTFSFPNNMTVSAFGFDYRPSETWRLKVNGTVIAIPGGRKGFLGFVMHENFPTKFNLSCNENAQGGLSVDNISYISISPP